MENLMKQMRGRFSSAGQGKTDDSSSARSQRIPPQRTQSFKGEKRTQNWFQKHFSGKMMSSNHDSNHDSELVVAVTAAAAAINLIAETSIRDQKKTSADIVSEQFTGEGSKLPVTNATDEKASRPTPSFRKPLSFSVQSDSSSSTKPRSSAEPDRLPSQRGSAAAKHDLPAGKPERAASKPDLSTTKPVSTAPKPGTAAARPEQLPSIKPVAPEIGAKGQSATRPETEETKAEAWEKAEMAKIKERYVKLDSTILAWEEKKKKKARNKLQKAESGLEQKRARALTKFRNEMDYIKQVVNGARAQAEARQRNDEFKAKEKANTIRTTGEVPRTCFCC